MAFLNTLFPCISVKTHFSDEEYKVFQSIDIQLIRTLICKLHGSPVDAINVVVFLLWLEGSRLSRNAVNQINLNWSAFKVLMLADQVVALLRWLEYPTPVWKMAGDISLIQELCKDKVVLRDLHQRRSDILKENMKIADEMYNRAFKDSFPRGFKVENNNGVRIATGSAYDSEELLNNNLNGVSGSSFYDPQDLIERNQAVVGFENASEFVRGARELEINKGFGGEPVYDPRELPQENNTGVGYDVSRRIVHDPLELIGYAAGLFYDPTKLQNNNHYGAVTRDWFIQAPRQLKIVNHNGVGLGSVSGHIHGHRELKNGVRFLGGSNYDKFAEKGPILPDVVVGLRLEPNMRRFESNYEVGSTSGARSMTKYQAKEPISEHELSVLLSDLNVTEEEPDVPLDDRTVFLTFSKGYPVIESELWNFFTRRFRNFIKVIIFQVVAKGVQPIHARMVARNSSIIPLICDIHIRTKYIIRGKHVWARKYLRKDQLPPRGSSSSNANTPRNL